MTPEQIIADAFSGGAKPDWYDTEKARIVAAALRGAGIDLDHTYEPSEFGAAFGDCVFVRRPLEQALLAEETE